MCTPRHRPKDLIRRTIVTLAILPLAALMLMACSGGTSPARTSIFRRFSRSSTTSKPTDFKAGASPALADWPEFGLDPQRSDATSASTGITAANIGHLRHIHIVLPGTVDSSPIYLHGMNVDGAMHDTIVVSTTYGKTLALDASTGAILWTFTPPGYSRVAGSAQITTASPIVDPDRQYVYSASPEGLIHKLSLADGHEQPGWPVSITRDPVHEKLAAALNIDGPDILAATGGYIGDIPPYQGHVVEIDRETGSLRAVFNTLCANRRELIAPSSCSASDSAILSRGGPVVEPGGQQILIDTGNAPWNGTTDFGDSVLELTFPALRLRQSFTPTNQEQLNTSDTDLGSSAPALLGDNRVVLAGKDGIMRVLNLARLDGHPPSSNHTTLGGEIQRLTIPGGGQLFSTPAVWQHNGHRTMFVADGNGTGAYALRDGRLDPLWTNHNAGTSPILAGGLLYVYEPNGGGIEIYHPGSPTPIAKLPGFPGHWNSPIVVDGHIIEPEGNANEHLAKGELELFSVR